jgi:hypothetical protein
MVGTGTESYSRRCSPAEVVSFLTPVGEGISRRGAVTLFIIQVGSCLGAGSWFVVLGRGASARDAPRS